MTYAIGRIYNKHGISDYFHSWDESNGRTLPCFVGKGAMAKFGTYSAAHNAAARCKEISPTIIGGFPVDYEVVEAQS